MKTVLFFVSSTRHSCFGRLDGVLRSATKRGWHVQVVERAFHKVDVRETLKFWDPDGIIAECGSGAEELNRRAFGKLPVVYFDRDPKRCKGEMAVRLDSEGVGRMAAKELLLLGLDNFAFVPFRLPMYWNEERERAFEADVKAETGKTILQAINDRIFELAKVEFAKGRPSVKTVAARLAVSRNTLDRIFVRRTGHPAGSR